MVFSWKYLNFSKIKKFKRLFVHIVPPSTVNEYLNKECLFKRSLIYLIYLNTVIVYIYNEIHNIYNKKIFTKRYT